MPIDDPSNNPIVKMLERSLAVEEKSTLRLATEVARLSSEINALRHREVNLKHELERARLHLQDVWRSGVKDGIRRFAVWKDGEQFVGVTEKPLAVVLSEVDKEVYR